MEKYIEALKGISLSQWRELSLIVNKSFHIKEIEASKEIRLEKESDFCLELI